ncbi:MAG: acyl carrier protein [Bdellovibrio sp.]|nr:acyl carrier protein [Bdellovibrio sp.]
MTNMANQQISARLQTLISNISDLSPEKVSQNKHFIKDLKFDSLKTVELIMAIYEEFGVEISKDESIKLQTVKNLLDLLEIKIKDRP